ncbi:MAG: SDR family NAD(P)-dependent oxidoreductase, partial [Pseudomonadota bacterium]
MTRTMFVTGASSGIGRCVAEQAMAAGWRVGLFARTEDALVDVAKSGEALVLPGDVTDLASVEGAIATLAK